MDRIKQDMDPVDPEDVVNKKYVDGNYLANAGGTLSGRLYAEGGVNVGTTTTAEYLTIAGPDSGWPALYFYTPTWGSYIPGMALAGGSGHLQLLAPTGIDCYIRNQEGTTHAVRVEKDIFVLSGSTPYTGLQAQIDALKEGTGGGTITIADVTDLQTNLDAKANIASPTLTGTPAAPTAASGTSTTQIATTAFVQTAISAKANLASPTFTGTPKAPTAAASTSSTQIATTAFVKSVITYGTADLKAGSSSLTTGCLYCQYE